MVNVDHPDPAIWVHGVVSGDRRDAVFGVTSVGRSQTWPPGQLRLAGLDPALAYAVRIEPTLDPHLLTRTAPPWALPGVTLPGRVLATTGLEIAPIHPEQSYLLMLEAAD